MGNTSVQIPSAIFMVRPKHFRFNEQTAASNTFQERDGHVFAEKISDKARMEFDMLIKQLQDAGVNTYIFDEVPNANTPDAVFPNNWISFHPDGRVVFYPMLAPNRRIERRQDIAERIARDFEVLEIIDLSKYESQGKFLEGTGSIVFDHVHKVAYANSSPRTSPELFRLCCAHLGYRPILFHASDRQGMAIYHTNVMMNLGDGLAIVCLEAMPPSDAKLVAHSLKETGHEIVDISLDQMEHFAGNMIQLAGAVGKILLMSSGAFQSLTTAQVRRLEKSNHLLRADLTTIEKYGGGSARCMVAGIHLPKIL